MLKGKLKQCNSISSLLQADKFSPPRNGKNNDKAHPPIHPTREGQCLEGDDLKVYEFIVRRFLACCSKNAQGQETTVKCVLAGETFSASGLMIHERNYLDVYIYENQLVSLVLNEF